MSSVTTNGKETEYTYDAFGNILTITEDGVLQHSYTYDARNQLVGETSGTDSYVYSYDAGGNLVSVQKNGEVIKSYTYGDASWKDLLTAFNGQSITYDAIGNPLSYRGMTLSWAGGRRLASVSKEGLSASYVYNTDGIRTQKTVNGVTTNYYLNGSSVLRQVTGNDVLEFFYDANGVLGFYYNNTPYYYLKNLQGDIVGILDANGTQVVSYTYDAWGAPLSVTGTAADTIGQINPFRYRSYYYDNETGLYYLNSRYYDPETYRFLNADGYVQTGQGMLDKNMFVYCLNNPVRFYDLSGNYCISIPAQGNGCITVTVGDDEYVSVTEDNGLYTVESRPKPDFATQLIVAQTIYGEGGGRTVYDDWQAGQRAVATVLVNRVSSPNYPNNFAEVCMQKKQFNGYTRGKEAYETGTYDPIMWDYAMSLAANVVTGTLTPHPSMNSQYLYFHSQSYGDQTTIDRIKAKEETVYAGGNMFYITWP